MSVRDGVQRYGDWLVALALAAGSQYEVWLGPVSTDELSGDRGTLAVLFLCMTIPLAWRRRAPIAVLFAVTAAAGAGSLLITPAEQGPVEPFLALVLGFYSVAAHCSERRALIAGGAALAALASFELAPGLFGSRDGVDVGAGFVFAIAWLIGRDLRRRRREATWLRDRTTELEREREEKARTAVLEERSRIARELHDVVAHSVSVMVVQSQAAQRVLEGEQQPSRELLRSIEDTGRQALVELRRLLGLLRRYEGQEGLAPQPSLRHLSLLVDQVREAGLPVDLVIEGEPAQLSPGVDLSAYRIVQEALTNTLKHAGPARAHVVIRYAPDELLLEVADDGRGNGDGGGTGQGLVGMRERIALYGGELESGSRAEGGYLLRVQLPLAGDPR